jgi:putative copper export protein
VVGALASTPTLIRLSLHVLGASVWLGGQIVVAGLLPTLRTMGDDAPRRVAAAFSRVSWPAYWLLVVTGFWNYAAVHGASQSSAWTVVFLIKMLCVAAAGVGAYLHTRATSAQRRGMFAGVGALATLAAMVLGVALTG